MIFVFNTVDLNRGLPTEEKSRSLKSPQHRLSLLQKLRNSSRLTRTKKVSFFTELLFDFNELYCQDQSKIWMKSAVCTYRDMSWDCIFILSSQDSVHKESSRYHWLHILFTTSISESTDRNVTTTSSIHIYFLYCYVNTEMPIIMTLLKCLRIICIHNQNMIVSLKFRFSEFVRRVWGIFFLTFNSS